MAEVAYTQAGRPVLAGSFEPSAWEALKLSYHVGDLVMPCCQTAAIPKTSPNGHQFFAHHSGECTSGPETRWHTDAKGLVNSTLQDMKVECWLEREGGDVGCTWKADVFFKSAGRQIAIEIQHSYQSLADYRARQMRYRRAGVDAYWLLYPAEYGTLIKSMSKWRLKQEFNGIWPADGYHPCIAEIPVAYLEIEPRPMVRGARFMDLTMRDWLMSILDARFRWRDGAWECQTLTPRP